GVPSSLKNSSPSASESRPLSSSIHKHLLAIFRIGQSEWKAAIGSRNVTSKPAAIRGDQQILAGRQPLHGHQRKSLIGRNETDRQMHDGTRQLFYDQRRHCIGSGE